MTKKTYLWELSWRLRLAGVRDFRDYISDYRVKEDGNKRFLAIDLKYYQGKPVIEGLERVSKPSCRIYCAVKDIPQVRNGLGTVILTTPKGIMSGKKAAAENVGGEVLCYIW